MGATITQLLKFMRKHKAQKHDIDAVVYWKTEFNKREGKKEIDSSSPHLPLGDVSGSDLVKSDWSLRECFKQLRFDKNHHLGLGDIRLTIAQQEEICELVERFYHCR